MPRRLDPEKGLPGLFARGRARSEDMDFLVRGGDAPPATPAGRAPVAKKAPGAAKKGRARSSEPVEKPGGVRRRASRPRGAAPATGTTSVFAAFPETETGSATAEPPITLCASGPHARHAPSPPDAAPGASAPADEPTIEELERAWLLLSAPPPQRVPEPAPTPPALGWRDAPALARCALAWWARAAWDAARATPLRTGR